MPRKKEVGHRIRNVAKGEEVRAAGREEEEEEGCARAVGPLGGRGRRAKWERAPRTDMLVVRRGVVRCCEMRCWEEVEVCGRASGLSALGGV